MVAFYTNFRTIDSRISYFPTKISACLSFIARFLAHTIRIGVLYSKYVPGKVQQYGLALRNRKPHHIGYSRSYVRAANLSEARNLLVFARWTATTTAVYA